MADETEQDAALERLNSMQLTHLEASFALGCMSSDAPAAMQRALDSVQRHREALHQAAQRAEPFHPDDDCSDDESAGGDPRSGCAITPTCTLRCYIRHQQGETQLNDALVDNAPNPGGVS